MIKSFYHKGLKEIFLTGKSSKMDQKLIARSLRRLDILVDILDQAVSPEDLNLPGFNFHRLHGLPQRYTIHINGPWCLTFEWKETDAWAVDLEQYH